MSRHFDVIVAGGGPAGSACAIVCARKGLKVLLIEREKFPRDKVCGDCLNPAAWKVLGNLGLEEEIKAVSHARFQKIRIVTMGGKAFEFEIPQTPRSEIGIRRRDLDTALLRAARATGVEVLEEAAITGVQHGWRIEAGKMFFSCTTLVAADGRNSTVARLLGLLPPSRKDRVGLQTHLTLQTHQRDMVEMRFHPEGYSGGAAIGGDLWNLCLVADAGNIESLKARAARLWNLPADLRWRSVTPLTRQPLIPAQGGLFLVGDAARVVEPFTGEGIYYAMASGELAGRNITDPATYCREHRALYRNRIRINHLARWAVLHPATTSWILEHFPARKILRHLTTKVIQLPKRDHH